MISDEGNKKGRIATAPEDRVYQTTTVGNLLRVNKSGIGLEHRMVITQNHQMCGWRKQVPLPIIWIMSWVPSLIIRQVGWATLIKN